MGRYGLILSVQEAYIDILAFGTSFDPISAYIKFKNPKHVKKKKKKHKTTKTNYINSRSTAQRLLC